MPITKQRRAKRSRNNPLRQICQLHLTSHQIEERSQQLETRVAILERELAQIKQMVAESLQDKEPWWLKIAGTFENDSTFDEAVRLGQEWRKSAE